LYDIVHFYAKILKNFIYAKTEYLNILGKRKTNVKI